jgi:radical SAM superfamily enzyme YgiQ (UPF0313 family)
MAVMQTKSSGKGGNMKLLLIAPSSSKWRLVGEQSLFNGKTFRFSMLSLLSVAAATPSDVDITIVDEQIEAIDWQTPADLVGITCMTALAPRAYEIARGFRQRGIPVVLGGMHPTLCPNDAARHADAIVVGNAEGVWPRVVEDARRRRLQSIYESPASDAMMIRKQPPRQLLQTDRYATVNAVQATMGCPNQCDFCAVTAFHQGRYAQRSVKDVIEEVNTINDDFFMFVDDNLTADPDYAKRLFQALGPLKKKWVAQSTLSIAKDRDFVKQAADAGCIGIFAGLETFSPDNLTAVNKDCHRVADYQHAVKVLHDHGICVEAGIVLGFDGDDPATFGHTLKMLDRIKVDVIQVSIFTPLPGTPRYERMKARIFDTDWSHFDFHHVVFTPQRLSPEQLQAGHDWLTQQFYRPRRIARRLFRHLFRPGGLATLKYLAAINLAYFGRIWSWKIKGDNPAAKSKARRPTTAGAAHPAIIGDMLN